MCSHSRWQKAVALRHLLVDSRHSRHCSGKVISQSPPPYELVPADRSSGCPLP